MAALVSGAHHIALKCDSVEKFEETRKFYGEILGMELVRDWGEGADAGAMFNTGNCLMEIFASGKAADVTGTVNHFALATKDVDACVKAVSEAGYEITVTPRDIELPSVPPVPARIAFCVGPVGEEIEFFDEK